MEFSDDPDSKMVNIMASDNLTIQAANSPVRLPESNARNFAKGNAVDLKKSEKESLPLDPKGMQDDLQQSNDDLLSSLKKKEERALDEKVTQLNDFVQNLKRDLHFSVHKETGRTVVAVIDAETDEIIRKIPSDEILRIAESLDNLSGLLINKRA